MTENNDGVTRSTGKQHESHETSIQPDVDNLEYRPWCHDCEVFFDVSEERIIRDFGTDT